MGEINIGRHTIDVSNEDKVFFPTEQFTKGDLIAYYRAAADSMLPYLKDRPLTLRRFPDGIRKAGFYQKEAPDYLPRWITTVGIKKKEGTQQQIVCNNTATLVYLADQAVITPHVWLSKRDKVNYPDRMIFDLDPPGDDFAPVRKAARHLKKILEELSLTPFVMTTGSQGVHVVVPLKRRDGFDAVRDFAKDVAEELARRHPKSLTTESRKNKRKGRIFIDYLRNAYGQTAVPPYAVRPLKGAPVAAPIGWSELGRVTPQKYTMNNIRRRLGRGNDPWKNMQRHARTLSNARKQLERLRDAT